MCVIDADQDKMPASAAGLLADLRAAGDDRAGIEAKRAKSGFPQSLWETVSAFANTTGGFVLLGVEQRRGFQVTGVDDPPLMAGRLASLCTDEMEPPVRAEIWTSPLEGERSSWLTSRPLLMGSGPAI